MCRAASRTSPPTQLRSENSAITDRGNTQTALTATPPVTISGDNGVYRSQSERNGASGSFFESSNVIWHKEAWDVDVSACGSIVRIRATPRALTTRSLAISRCRLLNESHIISL
jgi:hypothetical protein